MDNIESGIRTFYFKNKQIKIKVIDNEPYFHLEDVCKILEIKNPLRSKERLLDTQGIYDVITFTLMGYEETYFISENNLYRLIFKSCKPEAEKFAKWATYEVLPIFIQNKVAKKLINELEELRERNNFK